MRAPITATPPALAASLMPIYAALFTLAAVGLVGFAVAFWPHESESPGTRHGREAPVASHSLAVDDGLRGPREVREPKRRMKSM